MSTSNMLERISQKFNEATLNAFELLNNSIRVRTFFVGRTTEETFSIIKVFNKDGCSIDEGDVFPIQKSY